VRRGQVASGGGAIRLAQRIPFHIAAEMLLVGESIAAGRAAEIGLVSSVVPRYKLRSSALELAQAIAANAPLAVQATKTLLYSSLDWPQADGLARQEEIVGPVRRSSDAAEGAAAFAERRPPRWRGT
jgi:enoyl-CoA hydratase/carnithine racemase